MFAIATLNEHGKVDILSTTYESAAEAKMITDILNSGAYTRLYHVVLLPQKEEGLTYSPPHEYSMTIHPQVNERRVYP
jgi:hypothetical protein